MADTQDDSSASPRSKQAKRCKCGSTTHERRTFRLCPLNPNRTKPDPRVVSNTHAHAEVTETGQQDISDKAGERKICRCGSLSHERTSFRGCPLNPFPLGQRSPSGKHAEAQQAGFGDEDEEGNDEDGGGMDFSLHAGLSASTVKALLKHEQQQKKLMKQRQTELQAALAASSPSKQGSKSSSSSAVSAASPSSPSSTSSKRRRASSRPDSKASKPKPALSAYNFFVKEYHTKLKAGTMKLEGQGNEVIQERDKVSWIARKWKSLNEVGLAPYREMAIADKVRFEVDLAAMTHSRQGGAGGLEGGEGSAGKRRKGLAREVRVRAALLPLFPSPRTSSSSAASPSDLSSAPSSPSSSSSSSLASLSSSTSSPSKRSKSPSAAELVSVLGEGTICVSQSEPFKSIQKLVETLRQQMRVRKETSNQTQDRKPAQAEEQDDTAKEDTVTGATETPDPTDAVKTEAAAETPQEAATQAGDGVTAEKKESGVAPKGDTTVAAAAAAAAAADAKAEGAEAQTDEGRWGEAQNGGLGSYQGKKGGMAMGSRGGVAEAPDADDLMGGAGPMEEVSTETSVGFAADAKVGATF